MPGPSWLRSAVETDVCIIGGGAAGIYPGPRVPGGTVSGLRSRKRGPIRGGRDGSIEIAVKSSESQYPDLTVCRKRFWGGSTNHWAGLNRPPRCHRLRKARLDPQQRLAIWP